MTFLSEGYLWHLCWMIPFLFLVLHIGIAKREKIALALFHSKKRSDQFTDLSRTKRYLRFSALVLAVIFSVIAAARLAWGRELLPDSGAGRDLLILFDVSKSMLSDDVKPTRLEQAKWLVQQIVKNNPADRFGLVAFAGDAFLQCPLTIDKTSFLQLTDALDTDTIPTGGTNVQLALETAVKAFESAEGSHKAVILLTDGDELTGKAEAVTKQLAQAQIPLFVAGIGDPSNPSVIHVVDEKGQRKILTDKQGNAVKSPLNEKALAALARETSGIYVRSTATDPGLKEIQYAINGLNRKKGGSQLATTRPIERPVLPLCLALFFLLFFLTVNDIKGKKAVKGKNIVTILLLFSIFQLYGAEKPLPTADPVEKKQTKKEAAPTFTWAEEYFNQGVKAQKDKDNAKAKENYEKAIAHGKNEKIRAFAYQNLGVMPHLEARQKMTAANEGLKNQNPDAAGKELNAALQALDQAENLYRESLRNSIIANVNGAFNNQQLLLRDRKNAEELKKQIEELKKRQQQAQKQTQQAKDQQKKQNQQQQQKQNQKQQQQQKKQTEQQTRQAQQAVDQLRQQADKLKQDQLKKNADKAAEELKKARQEQQKNNGRKAEEHLQKALQALGADQQKKQQDQQKQDQQKQDQQKQQPRQKQDQQKQQQAQPQQQQNAQQAQQGKERDIDKNQAEAILNVMEKEEKDLRDMLKQIQKRNAPAQQTDKDW